jgi:deoxyribose-phosphate aldolase
MRLVCKDSRLTDTNPEPETRAVLAAIEHTLLAADARPARIEALCVEAAAHGFGAVCVNPVYAARAHAALANSACKLVCVVGFPLGASMPRAKAFEAELALREGAGELDMVMAIGAAKAGDWAAVEADARAVVDAAQGAPVKLILETGLLDDVEKDLACRAAIAAGCAFVKTCSGFARGTASVADVALLRASVRSRAAIKASGGIRSAAMARALMTAGASRLGTSAGVQIAAELAQNEAKRARGKD